MKEVSVDTAILKGRRLLYWIPIVMLLGIPLIAAIILYQSDNEGILLVVGISGLVLPVAVPFFYISLMLPRWRIWAFSNVRNVHELKNRAILSQIYPNDGSFLWRLEIKNASQKAIINELNRKFDLPDIFEDDYSFRYIRLGRIISG